MRCPTMKAKPRPKATGNRSQDMPSSVSWPQALRVMRNSSMYENGVGRMGSGSISGDGNGARPLLAISHRAAHQVLHQRDLVAVVLHRGRALRGDAAGDQRRVLVLRLADHRLLDRLQPSRHTFDRAADDARILDGVAVH